MRYPALNELIAKADNKYSLVIIVAKRARQIVERGIPAFEEIQNPVSIATREIAEGKLKFKYRK